MAPMEAVSRRHKEKAWRFPFDWSKKEEVEVQSLTQTGCVHRRFPISHYDLLTIWSNMFFPLTEIMLSSSDLNIIKCHTIREH